MDLVGQVVGERYRVLRALGSGAMGVLFEVENTKIGRRFALKTLTSELARKADSLARFRREAEIIARLNHPNVVAIVDWDTLPDGAPFYVMELLEGEDLGQRVARAPLALDEFGTIAAQAMAAVAEAHRHGVLHRDLKPANLFLCRVPQSIHVKVLDFGLARGGGVPAITAYDRPMWIGTPAYMSPEQIAGEGEPGEKADVWAMGAVLFEILTGRQAFPGPLDQVITEVRKGEPPRVRALRPDVPPLLADAIESAMTRDPERRITTIDELAGRVRGALAVAPPMAPSTLPPQNNPSTLPPQNNPSTLPPQNNPSTLPPQNNPSTLPPQNNPSTLPPLNNAPPFAPPPPPDKVVDSAASTLASPRAQRRRVRAWVWVAFASALVAVASAVVAVVALSGEGDPAAAATEPGAGGGVAVDAAADPAGASAPAPVVSPLPAAAPAADASAPSLAADAGPRASALSGAGSQPVSTPGHPPDEASGASGDKEKALALARAATRKYDIGRFADAVDGFTQAYTTDPAPEYLFKIAQAYQQVPDCKNALFFYKRYVAIKPGARDRDKVEATIAELAARCDPGSAPATKDPFDDVVSPNDEPGAPPAKKPRGKKNKKAPKEDLESPFD